MVKPNDTTPVVKTYPNQLYGESPVKTIVIWIIGVVIMTQFISWYISVGLETALYSGVETMAAAAAEAEAAASVGGSTATPPISPAQQLALIQGTVDSIFSKIDLVRAVVSIPILIFVGFVGAHYLLYTILSCLVGIMVCGSIIISSITGRGEQTMPDFEAGPWRFVVAHGLIESVFVPVLMVACILFLIGFIHSAGVIRKTKFINFTPAVIILIGMGVHNINNTRMGMAHGWTATWSSIRIGMIIAMVILGPLFAAGVVIRMRLLKTVPKLEESVQVFPQEKWKTLQVLGLLVGIVVTFQEFILRYYNAAMVQVVGIGGAPILAGIFGLIGVALHIYTSPKLNPKGLNEYILVYIALGSCAVSAICLLLPVGAMNNFFAHRSADIPVRAAGALVVGLLVIYMAFPIVMARITQLALRHTRTGFEFMTKCLLLAFFAINRILPCISYHNNRHVGWSHIVTSIGLVIASIIYILLDSKQEERLQSQAPPSPPSIKTITRRDIERQISIESTISSIPTMVVLSPRVLKAQPPAEDDTAGITPPNNSLRYPTISTFDEF